MSYFSQISFDSRTTDAFGRLIVASPESLFDAQFTYDLQPLVYEQITNGSGATVTHDSTNRNALLTFSSTPTGGKAFMQSYEWIRYQPGKSQDICITFNFIEQKANCLKFAEYGDGTNGFAFQNNGTTNQFVINSASGNSTETSAQSTWNIDKLDGTGLSGITLDITKGQILIIDLQALYTGSVRFGFHINGKKIWCHQFDHANGVVHPYIQNANLPLRIGMTCTGTVSTTMKFHCAAVSSSGGKDVTHGYEFAVTGSATAGNGTAVHTLSLRPKTTFNSIANRESLALLEVDGLVTGANPVYWELLLGQTITGASWADVNTTYSAFEYTTAGTLSGSPAIVIDSGFIPASNQTKGQISMNLSGRYPITLDAAGQVRANGTLTLSVTGIGGTSATRMSFKFMETR